MSIVAGDVVTGVIAKDASLSGAIFIGSAETMGLSCPTIDSAELSFQGSADGVTYRDLYVLEDEADDDDAEIHEIVIETSTGDWFATLPSIIRGINYLKIRSGNTATPVLQTTAAVTFQLVLK